LFEIYPLGLVRAFPEYDEEELHYIMFSADATHMNTEK